MAAFAEEGLDVPSLDSICARAGYTRGAFYVNFASRDDLIASVMEEAHRILLDALAFGDGRSFDVLLGLAIFPDAVQAGVFPLRNKQVQLAHFIEACARTPIVRERYSAVLDTVRRGFVASVSKAQADRRLRNDLSAEAITDVLLTLVMGVDLQLAYGYPVDVRRGAAAITAMLRCDDKDSPK